ncbi:MAG: GGDEF domain-containing phosphodiesterase [Lachnospiraceae bacterium]|nr:GGDEF domain-containing phosphodiesterase [Lachnospiraceae bacterium]MCM1238551.1 GGDEF domain-containing phosphodiesterase [Lachnospiraceae bacterium]MCM1302927.1 GGDEF domain-containing phosphodiesterase [Butyrivibrio sp.]MCM1342999.1 GGDEF domain-containing phosphodiesterase [Muribaculaceae bacterium]MCM1410729.1 GGDEF domain-containing phosphodiesterase [Lachnospiraceae bacterium]
MELNMAQYSEAIDDFLLKMEKLSGDDDFHCQTAIGKIGSLLRIALIKVNFYMTLENERQNTGDERCLYQDGIADLQRSYTQRETTDSRNVVVYHIYQKADEPDWSSQEREKLQVVAKMLYVYNGRARIMKMAEYLLFYDRDLKIHNLTYFKKRADEMIAQKRIGGFTACYFDLNHFSNVNQQVGKERGNQIMFSFVRQLYGLFSNTEDEMVCRVGGDNFIALFYNEHTDAVKKFLYGTEISLDDSLRTTMLITASAGFYAIPDTCHTSSDIVDRVSMANNVAKNLVTESAVFYNEEMLQRINDMTAIQNLFPEALKKEEFLVYYQPKVYLKNYELIGAEALCRWQHNGEIIPPGRFIPVLEQSKAICALDFYMLDHVCRDIRKWLDEGRRVVKVSVNLSRCHFGNVNLLNDILNIIDRHDVPHQYIEIELTETTTDVSFKDLKDIVFGLQAHGISTAVDDFGTGYSSLNLVRELPWNMIKIDKSFLEVNENAPEQNRVMLKHIIAMSQEMGITSIVEGVETIEHVKMLKENNCFLAQGFCFDKPLPKNVFEKRLEQLMA